MSLGQYVALLRAYRARRREQWYTTDALNRVRAERLRRLMEAASRAPYYRSSFAAAGVHPELFGSETVLQQLPLLEKDRIRSLEPAQFLTEEAGDLYPVFTSGSTGSPLCIRRSARDQAEVSAVWMRVYQAYGRRLFYKQVNIGSGRSVAKKGPAAMLQKLGVVPQIRQVSSFEPLEAQIALLRNIRPQVVSGFAVALEAVATAMIDAGVDDVRPLMVLSSGMELTDRARALVEKAFGQRVTNVYAANEVGCIAWECPATDVRGALHLNDDVQIVEIVDDDGRPVPEGQAGQVVITQLNCTAQPLIRYRIGDVAAVLPEKCACGRQLTLLAGVHGRSTHVIRSADGRLLNSVIVSSIFGPHPEVGRYQVRQTGSDHLQIAVVPRAGWTPAAGDKIIADFRERLGESFRYELITCDDIPLTAQGKFQTIVPMAVHGAH